MSNPNTHDVAIVGGGVMGCAVGLRLAQRGRSVVIIERGIPGAEASSAAAGILGPQWESDMPGPLLDFGLAGRALYPAFAQELHALSGIDIGHRQSGLIEVAMDAQGDKALRERAQWMAGRSLRATHLSSDDLRRQEPALGPSAVSGLWHPDEGHVSARALALALSQAAAAAGAEFMQGRYVRRVLVEGDRAVGLELDGGALSAGAVVIAAGSWSGLVENGQVPAAVVRPARGQALAVQMRPPIFKHVIAPFQRGYLVPRADGVAVIGSTLEMVGFRKEVTVAGLSDILAMTRAVMPGLDALPIVETWSNFRPYTEDQMPVLGRTPLRDLYLATGHFRYGILHAPITGQVIAELVDQGRTSFDLQPFSIGRFKTGA